MSEPITADWTVDGSTLYYGDVGAVWVGLHNATLAAHIAQAHNEAMAALRWLCAGAIEDVRVRSDDTEPAWKRRATQAEAALACYQKAVAKYVAAHGPAPIILEGVGPELWKRVERAEAEIEQARQRLDDTAPTLRDAVINVETSQRRLMDVYQKQETDLRRRAEQAEADALAFRQALEAQLDPTRPIRDRHLEALALLEQWDARHATGGAE